MKRHPVLDPLPLAGELRWVVGHLIHHAPQLRRFVGYAGRFDEAMLKGDGSAAANHLDVIEAEFGQSLWVVKNRIALLQEFQGLEAQKTYVGLVRDLSPVNGVVPYVAHYASIRHEETVTAGSFYAQVARDLATLAVPSGFSEYLRYHIAPTTTLTDAAASDVLRNEHASTVVDAYEALLFVSRLASCKIADAALAIPSELEPLRSRIQDPRLDILCAGVTPEAAPVIDEPSARVLEAYLTGNYESALEVADGCIGSGKVSADLLVMAGRSAAVVVSTAAHDQFVPLARRIVEAVASLSRRDENAEEMRGNLVKLSLNYFGRPWADVLAPLIREDRSADPIHAPGHGERFAASVLPLLSPIRSGWIGELDVAQADVHMSSANPRADLALPRLVAQRLAQLPYDILAMDRLDAPQREILDAVAEYAAGEYAASLAAAERLATAQIPFVKYLALRIRCLALLALGRTAECIRVLIQAWVEDVDIEGLLPIREAVSALDAESRRELQAETALPLAYQLYSFVCGSDQDHQLRFSYEDFLAAHGVERPSELQALSERFDRLQLAFFLWIVADREVMEHSLAFETSREITEERLRVCRLLVDLIPEHRPMVEAEIRELVRNLTVARQLRDAERSKIHVDREAIARVVGSTMRENFSRYMALLRHGVDADRAVYNDAVQQQAKAGNVDGVVALPLPKSETSALFRSMVLTIRDEFVSNSTHGLDGYLSLRIRHGTLSGMLRGPLEAVYLITPWDEAAGRYEHNPVWPERLAGWNAALYGAVDDRLSNFAREFDQLVEEMLRVWIQIRGPGKEKALFDFSIAEQQLAILANLVRGDTTLEEFVTNVLAVLDQFLEQSLVRVRTQIEQVAKPRVYGLLDDLQAELDGLSIPNVGEIHDAIGSARTGVQNAFDRVLGWFKMGTNIEGEPLAIEDVIQAGAESLRTASRSIELQIESAGSGERRLLRSTATLSFTYLFFTVFENIVRRSGLHGPVWQADIRLEYREDDVQCVVRNVVRPGTATAEVQQRMETIRFVIQENKHLDAVSGEGGTGFYKVASQLTTNLHTPPDIDFGFDGEESFYVRFTIPRSLLVA